MVFTLLSASVSGVEQKDEMCKLNFVAYCYSIIGQYSILKICAFGIMMNEKPGHQEFNAFGFEFRTNI